MVTNVRVLQYATVKGTYKLATTYCQPDKGAPNTVQLLTHGIGFDRSYWDAPYNNFNYSYVKDAVDEYGYATFAWDRLGIGMSQHGEPVNEIQVLLEIAALKALTDKLREGTIPGKNVPEFEKVLHVGHSFGSVQSYALTAMYPSISVSQCVVYYTHTCTHTYAYTHTHTHTRTYTHHHGRIVPAHLLITC